VFIPPVAYFITPLTVTQEGIAGARRTSLSVIRTNKFLKKGERQGQ